MNKYYNDYAVHVPGGGIEFIEAYSADWHDGSLAFYGHAWEEGDMRGVFLLCVYGPGQWVKLVQLEEAEK